MYIIKKNKIITINRGDLLEFKVAFKLGPFPSSEVYKLKDRDVVYFGLMYSDQPFEKAFLKKEFTKEDQDENGDINIVIKSEDTLELEPGTYYYEVKCLYKGDDDEDIRISTIVQKSRFIIVD